MNPKVMLKPADDTAILTSVSRHLKTLDKVVENLALTEIWLDLGVIL